MFIDIKNRLLKEVVQKGIFTNPYISSHGWEMWIDEMKGDIVGEQLAYAGSKIEDIENDDDQLSCWIYDEKEGSDFFKVPGKSYPSGVELPFPDIFKNKPGKYHIQIQFYVQVKGNTGGGTWSQGSSGRWSFNPSEGYVNVGISGGKFTIVVP